MKKYIERAADFHIDISLDSIEKAVRELAEQWGGLRTNPTTGIPDCPDAKEDESVALNMILIDIDCVRDHLCKGEINSAISTAIAVGVRWSSIQASLEWPKGNGRKGSAAWPFIYEVYREKKGTPGFRKKDVINEGQERCKAAGVAFDEKVDFSGHFAKQMRKFSADKR